jgi:hypothetical protein
MAIRVQINGKTRDISLEDYLTKDMQELIAEDIGYDMDELMDFDSNFSDNSYKDEDAFKADVNKDKTKEK